MAGATEVTEETGGADSATVQIRGSSVLLAGRILAMVLSGITQVLIVRHLSKLDYGAFAYALSVGMLAHRLVSAGHGLCTPRFLSIYDERRDYDKLFGTIAMVMLTVTAAGLVLFGALVVFRGQLSRSLIDDPKAMTLVIIMFFLGPVEALDDLLENAFAVVSRPRSIFVRKYLITPGALLGVVILLVLTNASVTFLATGFLVIGVAGVFFYLWLLKRILRDRGLLAHFDRRRLVLPFREVFGFGLPLVTTELVFITMNTVSIMLLGALAGTTEVASLRAILPVAGLNQIVIFTFTTLFVPMAARLHERGDRAGLRDAYWRTAAWLTVLSFPMLALFGTMARPVTLALFGPRYAASASLLAILSVGYYCNAALGFNAATLLTFGKLRYLMVVNVVCASLNVVLNVALIPGHGALGVAVASFATLVLQNVLNQLGLARECIGFVDRRYVPMYASVAATAAVLCVLAVTLSPNLVTGMLLAGVASAVVLVLNRGVLRFDENFPEVRRVPVIGRLLVPR